MTGISSEWACETSIRESGSKFTFPPLASCICCALVLDLIFLGNFASEAAVASMARVSGGFLADLGSFPHAAFALILTVLAWKTKMATARNLTVFACIVLAVTAAINVLNAAAGLPSDSAAVLLLSSFVDTSLVIAFLLRAVPLSMIWTTRVFVAGMFGEVVLKLLPITPLLESPWVSIISYALAAVMLLLPRSPWSEFCFRGSIRAPGKPRLRSLMGFIAVAFCAGADLQVISENAMYTDGLYGLALAAAALFLWGALGTRVFPSYSMVFKVFVAMFVGAFALLPVLQDEAAVLVFVALVSGSLLWFGTLLYAIDLCGHRVDTAASIVTAAYAMLSCQGLLSPLLVLDGAVEGIVNALPVVCEVLVVILVVAYLWFVDGRDLDDLVANGQRPRLVENPVSDGECRVPDGLHAADGETADTPSSHDVLAGYDLTLREREIVRLYAQGRSARFIAEAMILSINTVKSHIANAYQKMGIHSRQELISLFADETKGGVGSGVH